MNRLIALTAVLAAGFCGSALAQTSVAISVDQPGLYGQINIGGFAQRPTLLYAEPLIVERPVRYVPAEPVYLHVPPGQARDWRRYCGHYGACGRPVYFVREDWYQRVYMPRLRERPYYDDRGFQHHGHHPQASDRGHHRGHEHGHERGRDHDRGHDHDHH